MRELGLLGPNSTRNLIVFSPTSSGKTFVGEMAMVQAARQNRKVFYLVPLKALAEEKYEELRDRYDDAGIRVIVSSRDHSEFDTDILGLNFGIAVVVYEKLQSLLVGYPTLIERTGLVVVDELQILTDPTRGPSLELLLTKLITANRRPRIIVRDRSGHGKGDDALRACHREPYARTTSARRLALPVRGVFRVR